MNIFLRLKNIKNWWIAEKLTDMYLNKWLMHIIICSTLLNQLNGMQKLLLQSKMQKPITDTLKCLNLMANMKSLISK